MKSAPSSDAVTPCEECGKPHVTKDGHPACPGHIVNGTSHGQPNKEIGEPCAHERGWGCPSHPGYGRCRVHMGNLPNNIRAAQYEMAVDGRDTYGLPRDIDPFDALREEIARTAGHIDWLGAVIATMPQPDLVWGKTGSSSKTGDDRGEYTSLQEESEGSAINIWLQLYRDERKHLVSVTKTAITCGLKQREVELEEEKGILVAQIFKAFLADPELALTPEDVEKHRRVASRHLRSLPGAA